ncbi:unnamed protein product [Didymodactylos carnosus]|uniref:Dihydrolipoamide acetyltransferase component of pyruvate dehydrogenase complex n=1 Tax=Didymodactylos carnosus TaxID=1234261 RepID=A0A813WS11_9BILA|nr:unnamed protein product [Didymodactylos carnosus]CAF3648988.1 unnamed protein product [Didymodactylos carnosus]
MALKREVVLSGLTALQHHRSAMEATTAVYGCIGEEINPGDALCEIQTDKATMTLDTEDEGILAKIVKADNSNDVKVGALIAIMCDKEEDWKNVKVPETEAKAAPEAKSIPEQKDGKQQQHNIEKQQSEQSKEQQRTASHHMIGPAARTLMEQYGIDSSKIQGSGPKGVIMKSDVQKYIDSKQLKIKSHTQQDEKQQKSEEKKKSSEQVTPIQQQKSKPPSSSTSQGRRYHDVELSSIRKAIAKRLTYSKTSIPHQYASISSNVDRVLQLRKQMIADPKAITKVSVNDFIIKAVAYSLRQVPQMNGIYENDNLKLHSTVDISVAVATDSGLITPIVFNADRRTLNDINLNVKNLAVKAREGKLKPNEFQGGTFTISNLGMFGISHFSAVINPPQLGILAIGKNDLQLNEQLKAVNKLKVTLSYDARVCDPATTALFLQAFQSYMEYPEMLTKGKTETIFDF